MRMRTLALAIMVLLSISRAYAAVDSSRPPAIGNVSELLTQNHSDFLSSIENVKVPINNSAPAKSPPKVLQSEAHRSSVKQLQEKNAALTETHRASIKQLQDKNAALIEAHRSSIKQLQEKISQLEPLAKKTELTPQICPPPPAIATVHQSVDGFLSRMQHYRQQLEKENNDKEITRLTQMIGEQSQQLETAKALHQEQLQNIEQLQQKSKTVAVKPQSKPQTPAQKQAYANGIRFANQLDEITRQQQQIGLVLDPDYLLDGIKDGMAHKSMLNERELSSAFEAFKKETDSKLSAVARQSVKDSSSFLKTFNAQKGVKQHQEGFSYQIITAGNDNKVKAGKQVRLSLKESLPKEITISDTAKQGGPVTLPLDELPPVLQDGVQMLGEGGRIILVVPADKIYNQENAPPLVPLNAVLVYDISLLAVLS